MSERLTYRGLLADGAQDTILLHTKKGEAGYRIVKFQVIPNNPGGQDPEASVQIWKVPTTPTNLIDFSDTTLLAAAYYSGGSTTTKTQDVVIIFDQEVVNQDIYITLVDDSDNESMNYYIELERIKLSEHDAMVTTLQSIRTG